MVVPEVNQQLFAELEEMGFPKERATRALHYSGILSLKCKFMSCDIFLFPDILSLIPLLCITTRQSCFFVLRIFCSVFLSDAHVDMYK